jgi:diguanylate cyclase (GGDEF)-like protein
VSYQDKTLEATTSSIGVALFPQHGSNWKSVLQAADAALYQAKTQGRNRAVMASPSVVF